MLANDIKNNFDNKSEEIVCQYLIKHVFTPIRINTKKLDIGIKSPDFKVYEGNQYQFYCEVKNPILLANDVTKMFHWTTIISKIRRFIHRAVEQFHDVDNNHFFPWVIIFISNHFQLNWTNFNDAYLGYVVRDGKMISDLRQEKYVKHYNRDVNTVDAYIWCQVNPQNNRIFQFVSYINFDSKLKQKNKEIIKKLTPLASENIVDQFNRRYK